jgi:hypothetical protein
MKATSLVVALLLLPMTSCVMRSHTFFDRNGAPDVHELEKARQQELAKNDEGVLDDVSWCPLLALNMERYDVAKAPFQSGTTYIEVDAFGPLFMCIDSDAYHYDEKQMLYERGTLKSYLWGLYRYERNDVRVSSGWRYDAEKSLLFGLLRWPSMAYIDGDSDLDSEIDS